NRTHRAVEKLLFHKNIYWNRGRIANPTKGLAGTVAGISARAGGLLAGPKCGKKWWPSHTGGPRGGRGLSKAGWAPPPPPRPPGGAENAGGCQSRPASAGGLFFWGGGWG